MKPFFYQYTIWMSGNALYWYELMWNHLLDAELIKTSTDEDKLRSYLYAFVLVDLYGTFSQYTRDESLDRIQYDYDNYFDFKYYPFCQLLGLEAIKIEDYIDEADLLEGAAEYADEYIDFPKLSDLFHHVNAQLRPNVFKVLKEHYHKLELFALLGETLRQDYPQNIDEFQEFADQYFDEVLSNFDLIRAFEWWDRVY